MKRIVLIVFLLMFGTVMRVDAIGRHGSFSVVDRDFPLSSDALIMLNLNEFLDLGGVYDRKNYPVQSVKRYNISTKTLTDLKSTMTYPRDYYGAIKYDATHILLVGGDRQGSYKETRECGSVAEIYDIEKNEFTRISDTIHEYDTNPKTLLLSDGRVIVHDEYHNEIFDPKTGTFAKSPLEERSRILMELEPNELLYCKNGCAVMNLKTYVSRKIKLTDERVYDYYVNESVKISPDTVLCIGVGEDMRGVSKLDIKTLELSYVKRLPKALPGNTRVLLDNGEILLLNGTLEGELNAFIWYWPGKSLVHAVYNYKKNKIYKRRTASYFDWNPEVVFPVENAVYIIDYSKLRKYTYKTRRNKK